MKKDDQRSWTRFVAKYVGLCLYDIDNKELFPVSGSSSQKVCISSDSDTEEEENIDTADPESID